MLAMVMEMVPVVVIVDQGWAELETEQFLDPSKWASVSVVIRGPEDMSVSVDGINQYMTYNDAGSGGDPDLIVITLR